MDWEYVFAVLQLALAMLGMGLRLTPHDFSQVLAEPKAFLAGLAVQLIAIPAMALAVASMFELTPGLTLGLILVAAVPAGALANLFTVAARGKVALSISLVAFETAAALVVTPLLLKLYAGSLLPDQVAMPVAAIGRDLATSLVLPLAAGMFLRKARPELSERYAVWCLRGAALMLVLFIATTMMTRHMRLDAFGPLPILATCVLAFGGIAAGALAARLLSLQASDRIAIDLHLGMRNTNLALLLATSMLDDIPAAAGLEAEALYITIVFGALSLMAGGLYVIICRRATPAEQTYQHSKAA